MREFCNNLEVIQLKYTEENKRKNHNLRAKKNFPNFERSIKKIDLKKMKDI